MKDGSSRRNTSNNSRDSLRAIQEKEQTHKTGRSIQQWVNLLGQECTSSESGSNKITFLACPAATFCKSLMLCGKPVRVCHSNVKPFSAALSSSSIFSFCLSARITMGLHNSTIIDLDWTALVRHSLHLCLSISVIASQDIHPQLTRYCNIPRHRQSLSHWHHVCLSSFL